MSESDRSGFVERLGSIYEESPWVPETLWDESGGDVADWPIEDVQQGMRRTVDEASYQQRLELIRAHPDLAGRAALAGTLSAASTQEQSGAGLDQCTPAELKEFQALNKQYKERFGFPFIIAVSGLHRIEILERFRERLNHSVSVEFSTAIEQIHKIAAIRFQQLIDEETST